jgi:large subunit ribosomal protein L3
MTLRRPRFGSLQFYPRKRAENFIHSVNWATLKTAKFEGEGLLGFIAYKAGMVSVLVKDDTPNSMTKGKKIIIPATVLEMPHLKIFSVRFYKNNLPVKDVVVSNDKELKRYIKTAKNVKNLDNEIPKEFDDVRVVVFSLPKDISLKKTPDVAEIAIAAKDKLAYIKSILNRELTSKDFVSSSLVDTRGLTKGKGLSGPMQRFGISKKSHKAEKGVRRPGSLGPWHPARVTFRTPQAGQLGMFSRVTYNLKLLLSSSISQKNINIPGGFPQYGNVHSDYVVVEGSVQGPQKRQIILTPSFRITKKQKAKKYEFLEVLK